MWGRWLFLIGLGVWSSFCQGDPSLGLSNHTISLKVGLSKGLMGTSGTEEPSGVFVDTMGAIAGNLNLHIEWIEPTGDQWDEPLKSGALDVLLGVSSGYFSGEAVRLSKEPLLMDWGRIYVQPQLAKRVRRLPDMAGLRIGHIEGDVHWPVLAELISLYQIPMEVHSFSGRMALIDAIEEGTVDLIATGRFDSRIVKRSFKKLKATPINFNRTSLHMAYGSGLSPALRELIDQELFLLLHTPESAYFRAIDDWWGLDGSANPFEESDGYAEMWRFWGMSKVELILGLALLLSLLRLRESQLQLKHLKRDYVKTLELEQKLRNELKKARQRDREASPDSASL